MSISFWKSRSWFLHIRHECGFPGHGASRLRMSLANGSPGNASSAVLATCSRLRVGMSCFLSRFDERTLILTACQCNRRASATGSPDSRNTRLRKSGYAHSVLTRVGCLHTLPAVSDTCMGLSSKQQQIFQPGLPLYLCPCMGHSAIQLSRYRPKGLVLCGQDALSVNCGDYVILRLRCPPRHKKETNPSFCDSLKWEIVVWRKRGTP